MLQHFQDIVDKSGEKGKFIGGLSVRINMVERPVICVGPDWSILKQYIFTNKM